MNIETDKKWIVYMHVFPNNKKYIGITCQDPQKRWGHNGNGYKNSKQYAISNAIVKYGWDNIKHIILFEDLSFDKANRVEMILISLFKTNINKYGKSFGYNLTDGGDGNTGRTMSNKSKQRLRFINRGKKLSDDVKQKISSSLKKKLSNEDTRREMSERAKKLWNNDEYKNKQINRLKQQWLDPEYSEKTIKGIREFSNSNEYKLKIGKISKQKWENEERRKAASLRLKERWKNKEYRDKMINSLGERNKNPEFKKKMEEIYNSEERMQKLSEAAKKRTGNKASFFGRKHTDESKEKMSNSHKELYLGEEYYKKSVERLSSKERLDYMSEVMKEKWNTEEYRDKMQKIFSSDEHKRKLSESHKNKNTKKVNQYDQNGQLIKTWNSITEASESLSIKIAGISNCCNGLRRTAGGYIWEHYDKKVK